MIVDRASSRLSRPFVVRCRENGRQRIKRFANLRGGGMALIRTSEPMRPLTEHAEQSAKRASVLGVLAYRPGRA